MKRIFTCAFLIALTSSGNVLAAADENTQFIMEEVVVSATKTEEERRDVPNSVVLFNAEDIEASPGESIGQVLANEPGVDFRTLGNYGGANQEIHIRGMGGAATQFRVNGVLYNSPSLGLADVAKFSFNAIDRIEIVKGAGSLLYGSGAMAGTVNVLTKRPPATGQVNKVKAGFGSENTFRLSAEHGMMTGGDFGYFLTGSYKQTDGFRDNSDLESADVSFNLVLDKSENFDISLYGDHLLREYGVPGVVPPAGTKDVIVNGTTFTNSEAAGLLDRGEDKDSHLILRTQARPLEWLAIQFNTDISRTENLHHARYASMAGAGDETTTTNEVFGVEGLLDFRPLDGASIIIGLRYDDFDWENDRVSIDGADQEVSNSRIVNSDSLNTLGSFIEGQYRFCRFAKVLAGFRYEDHSLFGNENLPMAGLVINPLSDTTLKMSHGKHFLAPTLNDLFWPSDPWTRGNANLKPESGHHTDLTVEQSLLDDRLFFTASYFHWTIKNKILWDLDADWVYTPQNLDSYEADGMELGIKIGPFADFIFELSYTYTDSEEQNSMVTRDAAYVANSRAKGSVTWWNKTGLSATAVVNYVDDRPYYGSDKSAIEPVATLDSYMTVDLKIEQEIFKNLKVNLVAENLFDEEFDTYFGSYFDPETFASSLGTYPGGGQSFFLSVSYDY